MIDLHCHILPGLDDGSESLAESLEMAGMAVADGISVVACTPHIFPGVYNNTGPRIQEGLVQLQNALDEASIPLVVVAGADIHISPRLLEGLRDGTIPALGGSRYFLLELPDAVLPPRLEDHVFSFVAAGYVPIITHPERFSWVGTHYAKLEQLVQIGAWIQITGGSLLGQFGRKARYWAERMLDQGMVHLLASDAHNTRRRPPRLRAAFEAAANRVGEEESRHLVVTRPAGILKSVDPAELPSPSRLEAPRNGRRGFWDNVRRTGI